MGANLGLLQNFQLLNMVLLSESLATPQSSERIRFKFVSAKTISITVPLPKHCGG